jgi:hypothetical protein
MKIDHTGSAAHLRDHTRFGGHRRTRPDEPPHRGGPAQGNREVASRLG